MSHGQLQLSDRNHRTRSAKGTLVPARKVFIYKNLIEKSMKTEYEEFGLALNINSIYLFMLFMNAVALSIFIIYTYKMKYTKTKSIFLRCCVIYYYLIVDTFCRMFSCFVVSRKGISNEEYF